MKLTEFKKELSIRLNYFYVSTGYDDYFFIVDDILQGKTYINFVVT